MSLRSGMSLFPETVAKTLDVRLGVRAERLARASTGWEVATSSGVLACDAVVLAAPPHAAAALLGPLDDEAERILAGVRCGSSAAIFLGYRRSDVDHPLDATGFVVPRGAENKLVACTFVSSKWESRAPEGHVLLRAFVGGAGREAVLEETDDALVAIARRELGTLMGRLGEPVLTRVFRHVRASPQPEVGHLALMRSLEARLDTLPGVKLIGNGYNGTGIPDCIKQGRAAAEGIVS